MLALSQEHHDDYDTGACNISGKMATERLAGQFLYNKYFRKKIMKKTFSVFLPIILLLVILGCTLTSLPYAPSSETDTIGDTTPAISPSPTSTTNLYIDSNFGFKLQYDTSWRIEVKPELDFNNNGNNDQRILLSKDNYVFQLTVMNGTGEEEACGGLFSKNPNSQYLKYTVDNVELWRSKIEQSDAIDEFAGVSFIDIVSPVELYETPKIDLYGTWWGSYTCQLQFNNHGVRIQYILPVSYEDLRADNFNQNILTEMDNILISLTWE